MPPPTARIPVPFWRTPVALTLGGLAVLFFIFAGIRKLERINLRHQVEKALEADPVVAQTIARLKEAIARNLAAKPTAVRMEQERLVVGLYHGEVENFATGKELPGMPVTQVLHLGRPVLLAGEPSNNDSPDSVLISYKNYPARMEKPAKGQKWILAVWRDKSGNNVIHTAQRCAPD